MCFQKTVPNKNPQHSYKLPQNSYTVPGYDTRDTYLYLNSEKVMTKIMIYINMYLFHVSNNYLVQEF